MAFFTVEWVAGLPWNTHRFFRWLNSWTVLAGDELDAWGDNVSATVENQQVHMVGSDDSVGDFEAETFLGFEEPVQVARAIFGEAETPCVRIPFASRNYILIVTRGA